MNDENAKANSLAPMTIVFAVVYIVMTVIALWLCSVYNEALFSNKGFWSFYIHGSVSLASQVAMGVVIAIVTILFCMWGSSAFPWVRKAELELKNVLGHLTPIDIVVIGICSGIGEELLFRAALQPQFGLLWTSIFFGTLHFPINKHFLFYPIFATIMGFILGYITLMNLGCVTSAIIAHALINMVNLYRINRVAIEDNATIARDGVF